MLAEPARCRVAIAHQAHAARPLFSFFPLQHPYLHPREWQPLILLPTPGEESRSSPVLSDIPPVFFPPLRKLNMRRESHRFNV